MAGVSLDAMIPREDFGMYQVILLKIHLNNCNLDPPCRLGERHRVFHALRKPDFQRETNEWDSEKILW